MNVIKKILIILLVIIILVVSLVYDSIYVAPSRFNVRYETLTSASIPEQLNDINILYFTDLHYGNLMNGQRLYKLTKTINDLCPDVILFGGDLISDQSYDQDQIDELTNALASLNAPLGKFAIYGEYDHQQIDLVNNILYNADFEVLANSYIRLRNKGSQSIIIAGIDCTIGNYDNVDLTFSNISSTSYNLILAHTVDTCLKLPKDKCDYFITGHTHGGQINYFLNTTYKVEDATLAISGKHQINNSYIMDISNGVGSIGSSTRFLAYPEVVMYTLKTVDQTQ